jgi:putative ABC transport system permease protein
VNLSLAENLKLALNGLTANKARSALTMLGVLIGVATVIALLSIGQGASASITGRITAAGTDLLSVSAGRFTGPGGVRGAQGSAGSLTMADAEAIADTANVPDVRAAAPIYGRNAQVVVGGNNSNAQVVGTNASYADVMAIEVDRGRFVDDKDIRGQSNVAVLGSTVATELFGDADPLGQQIKVSIAMPGSNSGGLVPLRVVGVLAAQGSSSIFGDIDESLFAPITTVQNKLGRGRNAQGELMVSSVRAVANAGRSEEASAEITDLLRYRHDLSGDDENDFQVMTQEDMLSMANSVSSTLTWFLGIIAVISLVVGGIGIMNIMLVSVTERTREIGIRKAVGARRSDVLVQFLLEAVVLSVAGGLIGIVVGAAVAWAVNFAGWMTTSVSPGAVVLAVLFSLAVGLASGVYPASRAARLSPIEALRYE